MGLKRGKRHTLGRGRGACRRVWEAYGSRAPRESWMGGSGLGRGRSRGLRRRSDQEAIPTELTRRAARARLGERVRRKAGRPSVSASEAPSPEGDVRHCARRGRQPLDPRPGLRVRPPGSPPGPASGPWLEAHGAPEAPRTHLHEAVCVRKSRQHHLLVGLGRVRSRRGLRLPGAGSRHLSGLHGSSRENASGRRDVRAPRMCKGRLLGGRS